MTGSSCVVLPVPVGVDLGSALRPWTANGAFTPDERRVAAGRPVAHWLGRVAAKRAVLELLGVATDGGDEADARRVEILPRPAGRCHDASRCRLGHPPHVTLHDGLAARAGGNVVAVTISHTRELVAAMAFTGAGA